MALGGRLPLPPFRAHSMSDLGVGDEVPDGGLLRLLWGEEAGPSFLPPPRPISETLQRPFLSQRPELYSSVPSSVPAGCGLPFSGPQPPLPGG